MAKGFAGFFFVPVLIACGGQSSSKLDDSGQDDTGGAIGTGGGGGTSGSSDAGGSPATGGSGVTGGSFVTGGAGSGCSPGLSTCSSGIVSNCAGVAFQCGTGCRPSITTADAALDPGILCGEYQAGLGGVCFDDFDCLSASFDVARCSSAGLCEAAPAEPNLGGACGSDWLFPEIRLNEARVLRGPFCEGGACVLRHSTIDPSNTRCTSRCSTDRDCELMFSDMTSCLSAPLLERPDIFVSVCMPPLPW